MTLKDKAIDIHGKKYILVKDRVVAFNVNNPNGSIITKLVSEPTSKQVVVKAKVTPDLKNPARYFTGYSQAIVGGQGVNATAALENAETSAVGRALAMMGIGIIDSVASADEVRKATMAKSPTDKDNEFKDSKCEKCGAPIAISQQGKPYCSAKCWLKPAGVPDKVVDDYIEKELVKALASTAQLRKIHATLAELKIDREVFKKVNEIESFTTLTKDKATLIIDKLSNVH